MTKFNKVIVCLGLFAVMSLPLAGCSNTWHGMKSDWHHVTGEESNDVAPAPAQPSEPVTVTPDNAPKYN